MSENPFTAKFTNPILDENPFTAKATKPRPKPNPFTTRADSAHADKLAELDKMLAEAEERYVNSLNKALKSGVSREQVNKLFNVSDRHMNTLLNLTRQRTRVANGQPAKKKRR